MNYLTFLKKAWGARPCAPCTNTVSCEETTNEAFANWKITPYIGESGYKNYLVEERVHAPYGSEWRYRSLFSSEHKAKAYVDNQMKNELLKEQTKYYL